MKRSRDEREAEAWFRERYGRASSAATRELEQMVIGGDFGANGYTTRAQADLIAERLSLRANDRLLDVGAGRGWPGLYLSKVSECSVVLTDLPEEGLGTALRRAAAEGIGERATAVVASARLLPFNDGTFDAIVHTDVLCWLTAKLSVLRACGQLLRPGGRTAFLTIFVTPGLSAREHRRAVRVGPRAVRSNREPRDLLSAVGLEDVQAIDLTKEFLETARGWYEQSAVLEGELRVTFGKEEFDQQQADRREMVAAIEEGFLSRALFLATKPAKT